MVVLADGRLSTLLGRMSDHADRPLRRGSGHLDRSRQLALPGQNEPFRSVSKSGHFDTTPRFHHYRNDLFASTRPQCSRYDDTVHRDERSEIISIACRIRFARSSNSLSNESTKFRRHWRSCSAHV